MTTSEGHRDSSRVAQGVNPLGWLNLVIDPTGKETQQRKPTMKRTPRRDQPATQTNSMREKIAVEVLSSRRM